MKTSQEIKALVKEKYSEIALQDRADNAASCCGSSSCTEEVAHVMADDYGNLKGYNAEADLGLGCGLPTQFALIKKGDVVLDLGSGAGNDCFVARHETGPEGKIIGVDFSPVMIAKARQNAEKLGYHNMEFREGDIENLPVNDDSVDVIVSNCVLNLVPDKARVVREIYRTLKPGGHFSISDIVLEGILPDGLQEAAEMYAGCVSGALQKSEYLGHIEKTGFSAISLQKQKSIYLPDDILNNFLSKEEIESFRNGETGIYSITVFGQKPLAEKLVVDEPKSEEACCEPGCCD